MEKNKHRALGIVRGTKQKTKARRLSWLRYLVRMPEKSLPKKITTSQIEEKEGEVGQENGGRMKRMWT